MRIGRLSTFIVATLGSCAAIVGACGSHDPQITRRGGSLPDGDPMPVFVSSDVPVPWCAAYQVLNTVCQQCHQNPPINGAPIPLLTYADTQAQFFSTEFTVHEVMYQVVLDDEMPYRGTAADGGAILPKVRPLTPQEKYTLLSWLNQGATNLGGEDCPMVYDWAAGRIPPGR